MPIFIRADSLKRKKIVRITSSSRGRCQTLKSVAIYMYRRASNVATCTKEVALKQLGLPTAELYS